MAQLRQAAANLGAIQKGIASALDGREIPSFSLVLIGPMLWARFQVIDGSLRWPSTSMDPALRM